MYGMPAEVFEFDTRHRRGVTRACDRRGRSVQLQYRGVRADRAPSAIPRVCLFRRRLRQERRQTALQGRRAVPKRPSVRSARPRVNTNVVPSRLTDAWTPAPATDRTRRSTAVKPFHRPACGNVDAFEGAGRQHDIFRREFQRAGTASFANAQSPAIASIVARRRRAPNRTPVSVPGGRIAARCGRSTDCQTRLVIHRKAG